MLNQKQMLKLFKSLTFFNLILIILIMAGATFLEKSEGSAQAFAAVYGSWWFVGLWLSLVVLVCIGFVKAKLYRNVSLLLVHLSFVFILTGAMCTRLFSIHGTVSLHSQSTTSVMFTEDDLIPLPFELALDTFYIQHYPGTKAPADYITHFFISNKKGKKIQARVSMNSIFVYEGYRFYQTSYEPDGKTSILSVNRDVPGIFLTYLGYALFVLSMGWFLIAACNPYRALLKHPLLRTSCMLLFLLLPLSSSAALIGPDSLSIDATHAAKFGKLCLMYEDRMTSISAFAHDFTLKLTGHTSIGQLNADQVLMGFLFLPEKWQQVALFQVNDPELKKELNLLNEKASVDDFFDAEGHYKLQKYWAELTPPGAKNARLKEIEKLNEKVQLINMLHSGQLLQLFPVSVQGQVHWLHPMQNFPTRLSLSDSLFVRTSLNRYYRALMNNNKLIAEAQIGSIEAFQKSHAGLVMPSKQKRDLELFYLKAGFASVLFKINLCLGLLAIIALLTFKAEIRYKSRVPLYTVLFISFCVVSLAIGLRAFIAGRLPMSNGFETMLMVSWFAHLPALLFSKRMPLLIPFGFLLSGFALLVAHMGMSNPKITPLMPVLSSPLLSMHVSLIMLAYTLLGLVALNSFTSLVQVLAWKGKDVSGLDTLLERNKVLNLICLYPSVLFLGTGIFIGAVWANLSWGRYWSWDPKEVWALITFLVYGLALHPKIPFISHRLWFHVFGLLAFSTVLMTYFGVNYILGGMHSYAGEMDLSQAWIITGIISFSLVLATVLSAIKYYHLTHNKDL